MIDFADDEQPLLPPPPRTVRDTGLEPAMLAELAGKALLGAGRCHLAALTGRLRLSINVLREVLDGLQGEQVVEVAARGDADIDVQYQLTGIGRQRAAEWLERSPYAGPVPVPLDAWRAQLQRQALRLPPVQAADVATVFADDCLPPRIHELVGAAMHAGRSLCLYGPSGSGKSTLARKLGRLLQGTVAVPYAVAVGGAIIQLYDAAVHLAPPPLPGRQAAARGGDARWLLSQRPVVQLGPELDAGMLDLCHDAAGGCYLAPPQLKACHGLLIIDDLGRQRWPAPTLLNRLAQLLDTGTDQLALPGGHAFSVPCRAALAFATNLAPQALLDGAALRRIGYKVALGPLPEASYRSLLRQQCRARGMDADDAALAYLVGELHRGSGQPLLASLPHEIVARVAEFAGFAGTVPKLNPATLDQAWSSMFADGAA
ncbi:ATP-binding protein [Pseudoduganella violaceinigra]|uniref:ATP-binding protein n=1 Tax=Pseudoduganella violaceinigra TaxID=246602 RepID=UPI0004206258|nr:ATP-binding protein [Pseudoduganella violaceinigra]